MRCLVTAGPTCEPLDEVRRLTNASTGKLGSELANFLVGQGHEVILLLGSGATYHAPLRAQQCERFSTTADLRDGLQQLAGPEIRAVFHTAAVCDFSFGQIWERGTDGTLKEVRAAKLSSQQGRLLAELVRTPKILAGLRGWFPQARLVGWKYELDGTRLEAIARAERQIVDNRTDACVVNGRAYGAGFGLVTGTGHCVHLAEAGALYAALSKVIGA